MILEKEYFEEPVVVLNQFDIETIDSTSSVDPTKPTTKPGGGYGGGRV